VARPARVQLARKISDLLAEQSLHEGVDVLVGRVADAVPLEARGDGREPGPYVGYLDTAQDAGPAERASPRDASAHVLAPQPSIDVQAEVQPCHLRRHPLLEPAAPERLRCACLPSAVAGHPQPCPAAGSAAVRILSRRTAPTLSSAGSAPLPEPPPAVSRAAAARAGRPKRRMKPAASA